MDDFYLRLQSVKKTFSDFVLDDVTFSLPKGYIMGLVGKNGAGKTTVIKLILNILEKENGEIEIFGKTHMEDGNENKQNIGVVFDSNFYVDTWTVRDTERALSVFYKEWDRTVFRTMVKRFNLPNTVKISEFSRGMQMKLMIACAFSHNAKLLILDEPTSGLDPVARDEFLEILQEFIQDGERSVLFSTHITTDLERIADYITYLEQGKVVFTGSMEEPLQKFYIIKGKPEELSAELKKDILGVRMTEFGFEGLLERKNADNHKGYFVEEPTIEDIMIFMDRREKE